MFKLGTKAQEHSILGVEFERGLQIQISTVLLRSKFASFWRACIESASIRCLVLSKKTAKSLRSCQKNLNQYFGIENQFFCCSHSKTLETHGFPRENSHGQDARSKRHAILMDFKLLLGQSCHIQTWDSCIYFVDGAHWLKELFLSCFHKIIDAKL